MLGEQQATVVATGSVSIHGMGFVDVALRFADGSTLSSRLGAESVPANLVVGEPVLATCAANMVVSVRRPA